jgi:hypothetical protein
MFAIPFLFVRVLCDCFKSRRRLTLPPQGATVICALLHDIHPTTAMALPTLLQELKAHGFHVVQVVPAGERPKSVPELIASPAADKGAWPTVLTGAPSGDHALSTRQYHRIKKHSAGKRRSAVVRVPEKHSTGSARNWHATF